MAQLCNTIAKLQILKFEMQVALTPDLDAKLKKLRQELDKAEQKLALAREQQQKFAIM